MPTIWDDAWLTTNWNAASETWAGSAANWAWNNGQDLARIGFGVFDVAVGIGMGTTGIGGIPGVALMYIGIDQILTGSMNMRYGRVGKNLSVIENAVFQATGNETLAVLTPGVLSLGLGWYGSLARAAAREAGAAGAGEAAGGFRSEADLLYNLVGQLDYHMKALEEAGVEIVYRNGQLAYSPIAGRAGRLILDPNASLGALRHEYRHFLDILDAGYPSFGRYMANPREFARLEVRGYMEEFRLARELGHSEVALSIIAQMRQRVRQILGK